jgi:putative transposase
LASKQDLCRRLIKRGLSAISLEARQGKAALVRQGRFRKIRTCVGRSTSAWDTFESGRRFRILTLVADFTRECLCLVVDTSLPGLRVVRELDRIVELRGSPRMIVSDNGTALTSNAVLGWQQEHGVEWHHIATSRLANRCRMASWKASTAACGTSASTSNLFSNLNEARNTIEEWRIHYNTNPPHTSLNGLTPTEFAARPKPGQNCNRLTL